MINTFLMMPYLTAGFIDALMYFAVWESTIVVYFTLVFDCDATIYYTFYIEQLYFIH